MTFPPSNTCAARGLFIWTSTVGGIQSALSRFYLCFYVQGQWYFLRFLLHVFMVPCSFDDLKTVDREACQQNGLLENDRHHNKAQTEADVERSPSALRSLFAVIFTMYEPSDSFQLLTAHQENLCEPLTWPTDGYFASHEYNLEYTIIIT